VRFSVTLEGYDKRWIDAGSRRSATYNNLDPGTYQFRVVAYRDANRRSGREATVWFRLEPYFYETGWFVVVCVVLGVMMSFVVIHFYSQYHRRALAASALETALTRSQLQALRLQIQPHFLFNTLNAISGTILVSKAKSIRMIAKLSTILRYHLENDATQMVPLQEELKLLQLYLDIEKERFGRRLFIDMDIDADSLNVLVPSFILQPLVENAIHHGMHRHYGNGRVIIRSVSSVESLTIMVEDSGMNGSRSLPPTVNEGIGLKNTKSRLQGLYGTSYRLELVPNEAGGMTSRVLLPRSVTGHPLS
jgi:LytS/YehU family sensor histidine kinase